MADAIQVLERSVLRGNYLGLVTDPAQTVQTIATIVGNMPTDRKVRTTLIVAPLALLSQ
jgi:hypothetical protein